jgi:hypothetical protein
MVKKYSFEDYKKNEKNLLWKDFAMNILVGVSIAGCFTMAGYAIFWFIMQALAAPVLFLYAALAIAVFIGIRQAWLKAKDKEKKRRDCIKYAMDYQSDIIHWEERLNELNAVDTSEFDEVQMKTHNNEINFATQQICYYTERRDEEMSEYRKYGGKSYV